MKAPWNVCRNCGYVPPRARRFQNTCPDCRAAMVQTTLYNVPRNGINRSHPQTKPHSTTTYLGRNPR